ncbi:MAG: ribbon-helix-helix domain-containing protein [Patescibacteria group bacterium]|nr:ribbon-helix-helix domain-containing protein [Patescibacteria group bacterium]
MTASVHAELPEELVEEAQEFVRAGWATDFNQLVTDALRRYLASHSAEFAEGFVREDVQWGLHGHD